MSIEAMKLARQLLWRYRHETPIGNQPYMICQEVEEAFERIDQAISQSQKQEPVAYLYHDANSLEELLEAERKCLNLHSVLISICRHEAYRNETPLYTSQPQRQPLTDALLSDAVIEKAGREWWATTRSTNGPRTLAQYASQQIMDEVHATAEIIIKAAIKAANRIKGEA